MNKQQKGFNFLEVAINRTKGFTLIELLVVIAIIGLLSTLAIVSLNTARQKSRDTRRVADIKQMQTSLEMYFGDRKTYPAAVTSTIASGTTVYMLKVPTDPGTYSYTYAQTSAGASYTLQYQIEGNVNGITGVATATPVSLY